MKDLKIIQVDEHLDLSFSDYAVINTECINGDYIIYTNGVMVNNENNILTPEHCKLIIGNYASLQIRSYDHNVENWDDCSDKQKIKDICEFIYDKDILFIRGFGVNDEKWMEYKFTSPQKLQIEIL